MVICWFSCGVTSAVATKITLQKQKDVRVIYIDTHSEHLDTIRFLYDCERWFNHEIEVYSSPKYRDHFDVITCKRFINSPQGAPCTLELKKKVRWMIEDEIKNWDAQVFGFDVSERKRATRFKQQYPLSKAMFPLIDAQLSKEDCLSLIRKAGIVIPAMYRLGYHNNNCVGCVKGGKGYWTKIKNDFPDVFARMARLEREIGHSCIRDCFLDELKPVNMPPLVESCSIFCDPDFLDI